MTEFSIPDILACQTKELGWGVVLKCENSILDYQ